MRESLPAPRRNQSLGEEIANSISHGLGLIAAVVGTPFLVKQARLHEDMGFLIGSYVFAASMILLYLSSALYHALPQGKPKRVFRVIEHAAIYVLIAGTYTPFTLGVLRGSWGWWLLGAVWLLALLGVLQKAFSKGAHPVVSTGLYLAMGWLIVVALEPLVERMSPAGLAWLVAGGLSYTLGVIFFATDARLRYGHFVWHLFVMLGTLCHYFAILWYAI